MIAFVLAAFAGMLTVMVLGMREAYEVVVPFSPAYTAGERQSGVIAGSRRERIEQALIVVCRTLLYEGIRNGCPVNTSFVWSFLLDGGTSGSLEDIYSLPRSSSFSCSSAGRYGRYVLARSLPRIDVAGFTYDLSGLNYTSVVDPCGHAEIVGAGE